MTCCTCKFVRKLILKIFQLLLVLIEIGCAVAIIVIVAVYLTDEYFEITIPAGNTTTSRFGNVKLGCVLGSVNNQPADLCKYAYAVSAVSLAASLALSILMWLTCNMCGSGRIIEAILTACLFIWWSVAAGLITSAVKDANDLNTSDILNGDVFSWDFSTQDNWRTSIPILAWVAALCFLIALIIAVSQLACSCCRGGDDKESKATAKEAKKAAKEEKAAAKAAAKAAKGSPAVAMESGAAPVVVVTKDASAVPA